MSLDLILDDLRAGLRRRAARRRRIRATAATAVSTAVIAVVGVTTAQRVAGTGSAGTVGAGSVQLFAADGLYGCSDGLACWPQRGEQLNVPKHRSYPER